MNTVEIGTTAWGCSIDQVLKPAGLLEQAAFGTPHPGKSLAT